MKNLKKIIAVLLAVLMIGAVFAACSGGENASQSRVLKVGFDQDGFEPFGYTDANGEWIGFDLDLAKECVAIMDDYDSVELVPISWDNKDTEISSGNVDIMWNGFTIQGREDDYEWTKPYMSNSQVVLVAENSGINTVADLADKLVGTQKDSSGLAAIEENEELMGIIKNGEPMQFDGYETALMELKAGSIDALVIDEQVITVKIANGDVDGFKILDEKLSTEDYGVAAAKGNTELVNDIQAALDTLAENGKVAEISQKYFGYDATVWAAE